jgi:hypothetical protein
MTNEPVNKLLDEQSEAILDDVVIAFEMARAKMNSAIHP